MKKSEYYLIEFAGKKIEEIRSVERVEGAITLSLMFILPEYQNLGIGQNIMDAVFILWQNVNWRLSIILEEE